ncbi:MAG: GGDEF domain-containing protein [Aquabacterium sp.]|uniref:GGDEF domain-containing protein n=1 Tax=Aquabacterium sp. TaxID=1872578 RepID=UPI0011F67AE9|nr:GGDEF domain-containing protein [Aquabacterium sp.]TAK95948.1 MAG: GGDEF domain-containing protein [Aquabacterium sp.]
MRDAAQALGADDLQRSLKGLRFPADWEARFEAASTAPRVQHFIISAFVALLIYNLFQISDWFILPDMHRTGLLIRLGICTPIEIVVLYGLYKKQAWFGRQSPWMAESLIVVSGLLAAGSLALIIDLSHSPLRTLAHAGFAPMLVYGNLVQRLRFRAAVLLSGMILLIHGWLLASNTGAPSAAVLPLLLLNLVTAFFSLISSYEMEYEERLRFWLNESERQLLDELDETNKSLDTLSRRDALTGCANRRHAQDALQQHLRTPGTQAAMILLDVDHFKAYNDRYGHPAGDRCLQAVAAAMQQAVPVNQGLLARWGGEEFMVIAPGATLRQAQTLAESIRQAVFGLAMPHAGSLTAPVVSVSLGVAHIVCGTDPESDLDQLQTQADQALYEAKATGRNSVRPWFTPAH